MKTSAQIVQQVRESGQFKALLRSTSDARDASVTKERIVETLSPFFENQEHLKRFATQTLIPEVSVLGELTKSPEFYDYFEQVSRSYRTAKQSHPQHFYQALSFWFTPCEVALTKYWSLFHLEVDKADIPLEEFTHESFRNIGDFIEGLSQPFLRALLSIVRINSNRTVHLNDVANLDLGIVITDLITESPFSNLFLIQPWNIKLNQCRNIAYHHTARVEGNKIICTFGKSPNKKTFDTTREETFQATQGIFNVFRVIKLAYSLSVIDNITSLSIPRDDTTSTRKEAHLINLVLQFASQGFDVRAISETPKLSLIRVRDVLHNDDKKRAGHSSQFLFHVWQATLSEQVAVEYENADGQLMYRFSLDATTCEAIDKGVDDPLRLQASTMQINKPVQ